MTQADLVQSIALVNEATWMLLADVVSVGRGELNGKGAIVIGLLRDNVLTKGYILRGVANRVPVIFNVVGKLQAQQ